MEYRPIKALLIEDNPGDARLIRVAFSEAGGGGFELSSAECLASGLERLSGGLIDVVLLDLSLPDSCGFDTVRTVLAHAPEIPIVVLTGLNDEALAITAVQAGAQDYLVKGEVETNLLMRSIRYAIERQRMKAELRSLSLVDELTGLYNRRGFLTLARQQLKTADRFEKRLLLLFADLDGMKAINDTLGHHEGDMALRETAALLRETFRDADIIARLGGDEFAVLAMVDWDGGAEAIERRFAEHLTASNRRPNRCYRLSVSIGIALYDPAAPCSIEELLERGDALMYEQKRAKRRSAPR